MQTLTISIRKHIDHQGKTSVQEAGLSFESKNITVDLTFC